MRSLAVVPGLVALFAVLWDAFETIILPRQVIDKFPFWTPVLFSWPTEKVPSDIKPN